MDVVQIKDDLTEKTQVIITFALSGFANLSSIAILLGGLGGIATARQNRQPWNESRGGRLSVQFDERGAGGNISLPVSPAQCCAYFYLPQLDLAAAETILPLLFFGISPRLTNCLALAATDETYSP